MALKIETKSKKKQLVVGLFGRIDTISAPQLEEKLNETLLPDILELQMDLTELEYITSAGLRVLLSTFKKMKERGGGMQVLHANQAVMEVFTVTGFKKMMDIQ